ncbi:MAG: BatD family protein [Saprospiraceae bacterium]
MTAPSVSDSLQKNTRAFGAWAWAAFFFFHLNILVAQGNVTFEAEIAAKEVVVGLPFELTFTLRNADGKRFAAPDFSGFKVVSSAETLSGGFLKGQATTFQKWSVELTASKPGTHTIGAATVSAGGRTLRTKPLAVKVLPISASSKGNVNVPPGADDRVFVAAEFDRKEVYVGQQLTWRIRLYTQLSVDGYDIIQLPDFEGFFSKEKIRYDKRVEYLTLRGKKYAARTLHEEALFPQQTGELSVGAARVSVGIEQPGAQGFLFRPKPMGFQTQPISLQVNALPQPPPAEFTGGVGQYEWEVVADTNALTTDDALTITVEVKGNGDTRRFAPPKITVPPNCEIFEPRILEEEEYEGETEILHRKKFEYVVLPKDTGMQEINPVLAYFDSDSNRYCELRTAPIRLAVSAGKNYQPPGQLPYTPLAEPTIAQQPHLFDNMEAWLRSPLLWGILALPFLLLALFLLLKKRKPNPEFGIQNVERRIPNVPPPNQSINQASNLSSAHQRYADAGRLLSGGDPHRFYAELFKSLQAWLSARLGLQPAQMNDADLSALLLQRGATPIRTQALLSVWHTCEQAIYGGQAREEQMEPTWQMAGQVMEALEREIK